MSIGWWIRLAEERCDARYLRRVRVLLGCAAILIAIDQWAILYHVLDPERLKFPYALSVPMVSPDQSTTIIAVWLVTAVAFIYGRFAAFTGTLLVAVMCYALFVDQQAFSNHLYLLILMTTLATIAEFTRVDTSIDSTVAYGPILLMKLQLTIVYAYSVVYKINPVFLSGEMIDGYTRTGGPLAIPESLRTPEMLAAAAIATLVLEGFLAVAFWVPSMRRLAFVVGIGFHAFLVWTVSLGAVFALAGFGLTMAAMYTTFMPLRPSSFAVRLAPVERAAQAEGIS